MSIPLLLVVLTLLPVLYLSFDLCTARYFYLLTARNKSVWGFVRWWVEQNALFLVASMGVYLLSVLLTLLAQRYEIPVTQVALVVSCLFMVLLAGRRRLSSHEAKGGAPVPRLSQQLQQWWGTVAPRKEGRSPSLGSQIKLLWRSAKPRKRRRRRDSRRS